MAKQWSRIAWSDFRDFSRLNSQIYHQIVWLVAHWNKKDNFYNDVRDFLSDYATTNRIVC